ncbi:GTPase ObgE [Serpentinicella sp. ANB-PHB4]|uniref:GTPase ObgE n=1 Tax=Serpentinicella sp. ANB-PHB4 TaxID=3074076 RepID=UPI00285F3386|nr:GTPase ObgE [Serpentinicella sp. ANB-PHB4]MDR5658039.1 GTPase ObgE [Serpentinicella sp. ANB-PHB4]
MFVDKAKIHIKAGKGGNGAVAFRREIYVPAGGPSGGDGGNGGDIIFQVNSGMRTLMDFRYKKHYSAENGEDGKNKNMFGKDGEDLVLKVPPGTIVRDEKTNEIIADLTNDQQKEVIAKGGKGGKGNTNFKTATRQAPRFAVAGEQGEELSVILELKMIADVGLIGFPNVGKSTFLSVVTSARPKVADYHFTTLAPNLGVVKTKYGDSFVLADIPGLIEGAHEGTGLGHEFLRHIERTKLLVHVVDVAGIEGRNPIDDFKKINNELRLYNEDLTTKAQVVAANKIDIISDSDEEYLNLKKHVNELGIDIFPVSAVTNQGLDELISYVAEKLKELEKIEEERKTHVVEQKEEEKVYKLVDENKYNFKVYKHEGMYIIEGAFIQRLIESTNFDDMESLSYFQKVLKDKGVNDELKKQGIKEGDTVKIYDAEFEYFN